jgi:hypothetical protein
LKLTKTLSPLKTAKDFSKGKIPGIIYNNGVGKNDRCRNSDAEK